MSGSRITKDSRINTAIFTSARLATSVATSCVVITAAAVVLLLLL